jgi:hypothetical protein
VVLTAFQETSFTFLFLADRFLVRHFSCIRTARVREFVLTLQINLERTARQLAKISERINIPENDTLPRIMSDPAKVKLQPSDDPDNAVEVDIAVARMSQTIHNMLEGMLEPSG